MINLKLDKIWDGRNMGQIFDGCPLMIDFECSSEDGSQYKGWYYIDGWDNKASDGYKFAPKQYHFWQSKLKHGRKCSRKVSAKITEIIIGLIKSNISSVEDYGKLYKSVTKKNRKEN